VALRSLEERSSLSRKLFDAAHARGHRMSAHRFEEQARDAEQAAARIRDFLLGGTARRWLRSSIAGLGEADAGLHGVAEGED
jgi:hypothetical protein